jgi:YD repeat-containing protein
MLSKKSLFSVLFTLLLCTQVLAYDLRYSADILLNGEPSAVAVNPSSDTAAVVSNASSSLTVLALGTAAATHEIPLPEVPVGLAVHQASNRAIVATEPGTLIFFDLVTGQAVGTVETGETIRSLGVDEARGVLWLGTDQGLRQVELSGPSLLPEPILAGEVTHIMLGKSSCAVVIKKDETFRLKVHDAEGFPVGEVALPGEPVDLGLAEPLGILLVVEKEKPGMQLYDLATLKPIGEIPTERPVRQLAVNPSTHRAYLVDADGNLTVVDLQGRRLVETVRLFEQVGSFGIDVTRNVALVGHGPNLAIVQLENPVPALTGIMPEESSAGAEGVQLSVSGTRFIRDSSTRFNRHPLSTCFDGNEHLTATIPPSELELPGDVSVAVHNPPPGGGTSNELTFKILTPLPQVTAVSPAMVSVGGSAFTMRVEGKNFMPVSSVNLGKHRIDVRFVSSTVLEAVVGAPLIAAEGVYPVSVTNGGETSLTSNAASLAVVAADEIPAEGGAAAAAVSLGTGSLAGRILNTEMWPVEGVTIKVKGRSAQTDANGDFRLDGLPAGKRTLLMDGSTAREAGGHYPTIPITVDIAANQVNPLQFQPYLHRQKARNFVPIDPGRDTILTDPEVPGFEMRIPAGVNITGWDGKRNLKVSVRTVPADRLPVKPLPKNSFARTVYMFYFDKVGGGVPDRPIPFKAPNDLGLLPGEKAVLWYFDESPIEGEAPNDWAIAGTGTVTPDGRFIVSDPGVGIPKFCCGAAVYGGTSTNYRKTGPRDRDRCSNNNAGDPVNLATGYFIYDRTDYKVEGIIPVEIKRFYRSGDGGYGAFGKGTFFGYDWWLGVYTDMLLLLEPGNYQYRFYKQPDGTFKNISDSLYIGDVFHKNANNTYTLKKKDGWSYTFGTDRLLDQIKDPNGNALTFLKQIDGNISSIIMPDGKQINISYLITGRDNITSITGPLGTVTYSYYSTSYNGRLKSVQYPDGSSVSYEYDAAGRMTKVFENGGLVVTNEYDDDDRVTKQTHPDGGLYTFNYTLAGGNITETSMTAPNSATTTWRFVEDSGAYRDGYIVKKTTPDGATVYTREAGSNLVKLIIDPLGRKTSYTYDTKGRQLSMTDPAGNTTSYQYEDACSNVTKITDALGKVTNIAYSFASGTCRLNRAEISDPLQNLTAVTFNAYGLPDSVTDPNGYPTTITYDPAHPSQPASVVDPLGNTVRYGYDTLGRLTSVTDARGATTSYGYDAADRITSVTDPLGNLTRYSYDPYGNLTMVTDPKGNLIRYEYDDRDRITKMTDQLGRVETYAYYRDLEITPTTGDNLKSVTDRKGQATTFEEYDSMGRLKNVTYGDGSTTQYAYDAGGRVTAVTDSLSGTINYSYNDYGCGSCSGSGVDQIAEENTAAGTVAYTYDKVGRRLTMTVPSAPQVGYAWDDAGRLTKITRTIGGTARDFLLGYDPASRRTSLQVPLYKSQGKWKYGQHLRLRHRQPPDEHAPRKPDDHHREPRLHL